MKFERQALKIDGLKRTYRFLQISDCHIYVQSEENDAVDRALTEQRIAENAWKPTDKTPAELFCEALADADREAVDALLLAGDAVDYFSPGNLAFLREKFAAARTEILYVYGNHEGGHYKKQLDPRGCYPFYDGLMPGSPDFWVRDYGELLIVGIDDSDQQLTAAQVEALREQCARGLPILLLLHTPVACEDIRGEVLQVWGSEAGWFMLGYDEARTQGPTKAFYDLVMQPDSPIRAVLAGHDHFACRGTLPGGRVQYVSAPSFTGYARLLTVTGR